MAEQRWYISATGGGSSVIPFTSVYSIRVKEGAALPVKPVEEGSFDVPNKWAIPFDGVVEMGKMGEVGEISEFIQAIKKWKDSTEFVDIVTPYYVWTNGNIYDYEVTLSNDDGSNGSCVVSVSVQEIREIKSQMSNTGNASGVSTAGAKNSDGASTQTGGTANTPTGNSWAANALNPPGGR